MAEHGKRAIGLTFIILVVAMMAWIGTATPADAAVKDCSVYVEVPNRTLAHAGVTSVRNMSCRRRGA